MALFNLSSTRARLVETAIRVLSKNPTASMADIADAAGVQRMTLNRQLGTRENMMKIIAQKAIKDMDKACIKAASKEKTAIGQLQAIVRVLVSMAERVHFFWQFPEINQGDAFEKQLISHDAELSELITKAKKEGSIKQHLSNDWILASMDAMIISANQQIQSGKIDKDTASQLAIETLFDGIKNG